MTAEERLKADGYEGANPVLFYKPNDNFGWASNFSKHEIWLPHPFTGENTRYATTEHRFQAMKAHYANDHDYVNSAERSSVTKDRGRQIVLRDGWGNNYGDLCWYVMVEAVTAKALQHADVFEWLIDTGDRPLYEDSPVDDIWGWRYGPDHRGKNLLGRAWMDFRASVFTIADLDG